VEFLQFLHGDLEINTAPTGDGETHKTARYPHAYWYILKRGGHNGYEENWRVMEEVGQARQGLPDRPARPRRFRQGSGRRVSESGETERAKPGCHDPPV